ncbi:hypothetical protein LJC63_07260 [Ruminococcaceae bacterium OttesenSCG-928-L11]|nr:hypothetical protein [Ruminococcaceae bacterium OttesenSCG-928-L11]
MRVTTNRRILSILLAIFLCVSMAPGVLASQSSDMALLDWSDGLGWSFNWNKDVGRKTFADGATSYYDTLNAYERTLYLSLGASLNAPGDLSVTIPYQDVVYYTTSGLSLNTAMTISGETAVNAYIYDNPDFYWVDPFNGIDLDGSIYGTNILREATITFTADTANINHTDMEASINDTLNGITATNAAEIVKEANAAVKNLATYYEGPTETYMHHISGVFAEGQAVCEGYAKAMKLILDKKGITNILITGKLDGVDHMWNAVKIDGSWYYVDTTNDDVNNSEDFLLKGADNDAYATHVADDIFNGFPVSDTDYGSTAPTDPTDPTGSTDPTDPTDPTDSTDPTDPTEPTGVIIDDDDDDDDDDDGSTGGGGGSTGGGSTNTGTTGSGTSTSETAAPVTAAQVNNAIEKAVQSAANGGTATIKLQNVGEISLANLKTIAAASETPTKLQADSLSADGKIETRITLDPSLATSAINLSASTDSKEAKQTNAIFTKFFANENLSVLSLGQKGSFGQPVAIATKLDITKLNVETLEFYSYDLATNTYKRIETTYTVDANGYVHFTTQLAGEIVISDKPLVKKA